METEKAKKVEEFMLEEYTNFASDLNEYEWPWEMERWYELVFCLMAKIDESAEATAIARETTQIFSDLDLIELEALAKLVSGKGDIDYSEPQLTLMLDIMKWQGYEVEDAKKAVATICQAAYALQKGFGGKAQKYLRKYGEMMVAEAPAVFSFSHLKAEDTKYVITHWLQNVLDMPVLLPHPSMKAVCGKLGISVEQLAEIADENDVNLSMLDDWTIDYMENESGSEE